MTVIGHHGSPVRLSLPDAATVHHAVVIGRHVVIASAILAVVIGAFVHPVDGFTRVEVASSADAATVQQQLRVSAAAQLRSVQEATSSAQLSWQDSADRVLDDSARARLHAAITHAEQVIARVRTGVVWPGTSLEVTVAADAVTLDDEKASLAESVRGVEDAVAAWEAEQARLAAEEAARQAAAAAAAAARAAGGARTAPAGAAGMHIERIWTSGGQAEIDACRGSVNMPPIASYLGGGFYAAEHWTCGGSAWGGIGTGSLVEFAGYGTYEVAGRVSGLSYGVDASVIPGGYAGYYQTCIGGSSSNMTVWLLTRVG